MQIIYGNSGELYSGEKNNATHLKQVTNGTIVVSFTSNMNGNSQTYRGLHMTFKKEIPFGNVTLIFKK